MENAPMCVRLNDDCMNQHVCVADGERTVLANRQRGNSAPETAAAVEAGELPRVK